MGKSAQAAELMALCSHWVGKRQACFSHFARACRDIASQGFDHSKGNPLKHTHLILCLLDTVMLPKVVAVMYSTKQNRHSERKREADWAAKHAAGKGNLVCMMPIIPRADLPYNPIYGLKDKELVAKCPAKQHDVGCWLTEDECIVFSDGWEWEAPPRVGLSRDNSAQIWGRSGFFLESLKKVFPEKNNFFFFLIWCNTTSFLLHHFF